MIIDATELDFVEKVLACDRPVMVCFRSSYYLKGMIGELASGPFFRAFVLAAYELPDVQAVIVDLGRVPMGQAVAGVTIWSHFPRIALYEDGKEIASKDISLRQAMLRQAPRKVAEWVTKRLEIRSPRAGRPTCAKAAKERQ